MQTIFERAIELVKKGHRFSVDLKERSLRVGGKYLIRNGNFALGATLLEFSGNPIEHLLQLHERYVYSVPSERSQSSSRLYFRALPEHELSMEDIMFGEPREVARCRLELTLLCFILLGTVNWETFSQGDERMWFWKNNTVPSMVILKEWIN